MSAPHAAKLARIGLEHEIPYCAQVDITASVPVAVASDLFGIVVKRAGAAG